ncbi:glycosyltransferase family A protein [Kitasatospora purpeofusca]|uniref:glycosyltransferase family A protein n=1 Tax=Kitasatospora purpeofusca TaxID=67352 RepID=UPI003F4AA1F2
MTFSVTVVVPAHNAARTLSACLDPVYAQTHRPHQVIVVDDGSTDATARIAQVHAAGGGPTGGSAGSPAGGPPCELIRQRPNRGVSAARNAGIAAATGEVIFFLDSDEALTPDSVANALEILEKDPECGCVHGVIAPEPLFDDGPVERYRVLHAHWWRVRGAGDEVERLGPLLAGTYRRALEAEKTPPSGRRMAAWYGPLRVSRALQGGWGRIRPRSERPPAAAGNPSY